MTRSRLTKLFAAVMVVTATLTTPVMTQSASAGTPTCNDPGTRVPVILVHGLNGSEADFTAHANGADDLIKRLGTIPNVFTDLFDYSSVADQWVKNAGIGQALADRIGCLAAKSKAAGGIGKVVIVAHSMGGLAARQAMSLNYTATHAPVGPSVGLLVTVATPNTGSWSDALFHNVRSGEGGVSLSELTWLVQGICGGVGAYTGPKRPGICGVLQGSTSDAGTAMLPGSHELAKLPPPPSDLPVDAVAGQLTVTTTLFLIHKTYTLFPSGELGDILVKTNSALAYGSGSGRQSFVQPCTLSISQVWNGQGWNGCTHGGLLYDPTVGQKITSWVQSWTFAADVVAAPCSFAALSTVQDLEDGSTLPTPGVPGHDSCTYPGTGLVFTFSLGDQSSQAAADGGNSLDGTTHWILDNDNVITAWGRGLTVTVTGVGPNDSTGSQAPSQVEQGAAWLTNRLAIQLTSTQADDDLMVATIVARSAIPALSGAILGPMSPGLLSGDITLDEVHAGRGGSLIGWALMAYNPVPPLGSDLDNSWDLVSYSTDPVATCATLEQKGLFFQGNIGNHPCITNGGRAGAA